MNVSELIECLSAFNGELPVSIIALRDTLECTIIHNGEDMGGGDDIHEMDVRTITRTFRNEILLECGIRSKT